MRVTRRAVMIGTAAALATPVLRPAAAEALSRRIPATGEPVPAVGIGSWITFNVGDDPVLRAECRAVMAAFFEAGGGIVDSSPMYGSSQAVIGHALEALGHAPGLFSADKVWTDGAGGRAQIAETRRRWGVDRFDLLQVHNLVDWEANLDTLDAMKEAGRLRYTGVTTSHGRRHEALEQVMRRRPPDFVQLTYNILDREAERRLLPLALERGIAVICNRPFQRGRLPERLAGRPLPGWASEIGVSTWPQFLLKFIISHPAVTSAIPATRQVEHVRENKSAALGPMPDAAMRRRMAAHVESL
ncbi:MAG: aldo/keto reductase [Rhodospirillales bacterium]|nr:aldo/keto reductase [Rhodospirillales bacterium]MDE0382191.1 aldo/keto reductase [Rhodospirillales bacterium]